MQSKTAEIKFETQDGYFVAPLQCGGIRVGLVDCECFDFPADHEEHTNVAALTADNVEAAYDSYFGMYCC